MIRKAKALSEEVTITNELGMHARSAAMIAKLAAQAGSKIWISKGAEKADASSIMDMLTLEGVKGTKLKITAEDSTDLKILDKIINLIGIGFGE